MSTNILAQDAETGQERLNTAHIKSFYAQTCPAGYVIETRVPHLDGKGTGSGFFSDGESFISTVESCNGRAAGIYSTLNPVNPENLPGKRGVFYSFAKKNSTTSDRMILCWRFLLVDLDPIRPGKVSSSEEEHRAALNLALTIRAFLMERGIYSIYADSGNGAHLLLYLKDLPNNPETTKLCRALLQGLACMFNTETVIVDTSTANASRISKVYGTMAMKGKHSEERPHRLTRLLDIPAEPIPTTPETLKRVLKDLGGEDNEDLVTAAALIEDDWPSSPDNYPPADFDLISKNCRFMRHWAENAAGLTEPEWYAGISVTVRCVNGETRAHDCSSLYPGYTADETEKKITHALEASGPATCQRLKQQFPELCKDCNRRVKSPISLGYTSRLHIRPGQHPYVIENGCIGVKKKSKEIGEYTDPLCNFTAQIDEEITLDDGMESRKALLLTGTLASGEPLPACPVPAHQFACMNWITGSWGTRAIFGAGAGCKDHIRAAIQNLSLDAGCTTYRHTYQHTGWRKIDGRHCYLTKGGAITAEGLIDSVSVELETALKDYQLPAPPEAETLPDLIKKALIVLELAPDEIAVPVLFAPFRAVLAVLQPCDNSLFFEGQTGTQKTELTALAQSFFGAGFHGKNLPGSWSSTANALERTSFLTSASIFVVDDFNPTGTQIDMSRYHREADRLFRAAGNQAGRSRMNADGSTKNAYYPRGLIVSSGETIPDGHSLRARLLIAEVQPGDVNLSVLTTCQQYASDGVFASLLSGFISWVTQELDSRQDYYPLEDEFKAFAQIERDRLRQGPETIAHDRTPDIIGQWLATENMFRRFATWARLDPDTLGTVNDRARAAFINLGKMQAQHQKDADPTSRFLELLRACLSGGYAHINAIDGKAPMQAALWGWSTCTDFGAERAYQWQGALIGWIDGQNLYLKPDETYKVIAEYNSSQRSAALPGEKTLWKRLKDKGIICNADQGKSTRKILLPDGKRIRVINLLAPYVYTE